MSHSDRMEDVTAVILAGGLGTRLGGVKKALIDVGGKPIVVRIMDALGSTAHAFIVVDNDSSLAHLPGVRIVPDVETRAGVLTALYSGLRRASTPLCVVFAADMPFVNGALVQWLVSLSAGFDVVVPVVGDQMEPMHAVYRRESCLSAIERSLAKGEKRMVSFFGDVRVRQVGEAVLRQFDPDLRSFFNVNTPDDLAWARQVASG